MIIDFHTHVFPEAIAQRALDKLSASAQIPFYTNGTIGQLKASMDKNDIAYSVLLPVCTRPAQTDSINRTAITINEQFSDTGILSFGGIHPGNADYRQILKQLKANGVKGIKLHPVYQRTYFDDIHYMRIIDCACEYDFIITVHAGYDIGFLGDDFVTPAHILPVIRQIKPDKLILAHMGGWGCWDEVEELVSDSGIWLDTSFSLPPIHMLPDCTYTVPTLEKDLFCRIARAAGIHHVLFGTDSPWSQTASAIQSVKDSGLTQSELDAVFSENAQTLLNL